MTGDSRNWLVVRGRLRRRAGSNILGDTISDGHEVTGILETSIGFLARRFYAALLASMVDLFPTTLLLFTEEATTGAATICYRSTNGADSWRVIGDGFDGTSYPDSGVPTHRVVPMVYDNQWGGMTIHRLNTATDRQYACAGSRSLLLGVGGQICWGGLDSAPMRWKSDDNETVLPLGLIPPLQMPTCSAGNSLGASVVGPFKGSQAWLFTCIAEDENGELSLFPIPRPPGSAWSGFDGFGYVQVDSDNPTYYYDSVVYLVFPSWGRASATSTLPDPPR